MSLDDPAIRSAWMDVCKNGNLTLQDTSPSEYSRRPIDYYLSVYVEADPLVVEDSIYVTARVGQTQIPMMGNGEGHWHGVFHDRQLCCQYNFDILFRVTWQAKSDYAEMLFDRSKTVRSNKDIVGDGTIVWSPATWGSVTSSFRESQSSGAPGAGWISFSVGLQNLMAGDALTVHGFDVYCWEDTIWRPAETNDPWRVLDTDQLSSPVYLQCGEEIDFPIGWNFYYGDYFSPALLVVRTNLGPLFRLLEIEEPLSG